MSRKVWGAPLDGRLGGFGPIRDAQPTADSSFLSGVREPAAGATRAKAIRLVHDHVGAAPRGMGDPHDRRPARDGQQDAAYVGSGRPRLTTGRSRTTSAAAREIRELKRKNTELEQTFEIFKAATSFFVLERDPRQR